MVFFNNNKIQRRIGGYGSTIRSAKMSDGIDIEVHRNNGDPESEVIGLTDTGIEFLEAQYGGSIKVDNQTLGFMLEYLSKFGLTARLIHNDER